MFEEQYLKRYHDKVVVMNVNYSDIPVRGNLVVTEDDERDRQLEDSVITRLDDGDVWAWADVEIYVEKGGVKSESEHIGGCSYKDSDDFIKCGYYEDMVARCLNSISERDTMKNYENLYTINENKDDGSVTVYLSEKGGQIKINFEQTGVIVDAVAQDISGEEILLSSSTFSYEELRNENKHGARGDLTLKEAIKVATKCLVSCTTTDEYQPEEFAYTLSKEEMLKNLNPYLNKQMSYLEDSDYSGLQAVLTPKNVLVVTFR